MEKSLLPVDGKPVCRYIVDNLRRCENIGKITILCLTKFKKQFEHEFRDIPSIKIEEMLSPLGTFTTFYAFTPSHEKHSEWVMVHYADCMTEIDYDDFISKIDEKYDGMIAVTNTVKHDYSEVAFTIDGVVQDFVEKPNLINYSWSGIGLFHVGHMHTGYRYTAPGPMDFAFDIFPQMIEQKKLKAYPYNGFWFDMGNLNSYMKVCALYDTTNGDVKL